MIESALKSIPTLAGIPRAKLVLTPLSGLTNINYLVSTPDKKYVLRIPKYPSNNYINRKQEAYNSDIAQKLGLCPATIFRHTNDNNEVTGLSLTEYIENSKVMGTTNCHDFQGDTILEATSQLLVTLQSSNRKFKGILDKQKFIELLKKYFKHCSKEQREVLSNDYQNTLNLLSGLINNRPAVPSHVDLVKENILFSAKNIWLIDWEYSAMASPFWDIATLCHSLNLNKEKEQKVLKLVLGKLEKLDIENLKSYKSIVNSLSLCWEGAVLNQTNNLHRLK